MKIGLLLPDAPDLGLLCRAQAMGQYLVQLRLDDRPTHVAIGLPGDQGPHWRARARELHGHDAISIRHLVWENVPVDQIVNMYAGKLGRADLAGLDELMVPRDWGWNFTDCDLWISFADPGQGALVPLVPTLHYCRDLAARIVPDAFAAHPSDPYWKRQVAAFNRWRQAIVLVSDPTTVSQVNSYAGVKNDRIMLISDTLEGFVPSLHAAPDASPRLDLAWLADASPLYDLPACLRGLQIYWSEGGSVRPTILCENVEKLEALCRPSDRQPISPELAQVLAGLPKTHLFSRDMLWRLLGRSSGLWSSRIAGGDGEAVWYAKTHDLRLLCADQPTNRAAVARLAVNALRHQTGDSLAIADALHAFSSEIEPTPDATRAAGHENARTTIVDAISRALAFDRG